MTAIRTYKDLEIWQLSVDLTVKVYKLIETFPKEEKYSLTAQIKDAVVSVSSNIAESFGRYHTKDKINFIYNARGSLFEVESELAVAIALGFINNNNELYKEIAKDITRLSVKINNYRSVLRNST